MGGKGVCTVMADGTKKTFINGCLASCNPDMVVVVDTEGPCK